MLRGEKSVVGVDIIQFCYIKCYSLYCVVQCGAHLEAVGGRATGRTGVLRQYQPEIQDGCRSPVMVRSET